MTTVDSPASLYDRLGGQPAISAVVDKFYDLMLEDPRVSHYFSSADMEKQRARQKQFISMVAGGPSNYEGKDMKASHCKHNITHAAFDVTWEHLEEALRFFKVKSPETMELREVFYSVKSDIVREEAGGKGKCPFGNLTNSGETVSSQNSKAQSILKKACPFEELKIAQELAA